MVECAIVGVQLSVHHIAVAFQKVVAFYHRGGICAFALHFIPAKDVACVVGAIGHHNLVLVG